MNNQEIKAKFLQLQKLQKEYNATCKRKEEIISNASSIKDELSKYLKKEGYVIIDGKSFLIDFSDEFGGYFINTLNLDEEE